MAAIVIVGAQWGDEGKGKATDILGGLVDYVVKPNGGNNAGHTVVVGGEKYELKLLPAGVLSENATPILGNGVVINLEALFEEIDGLEARGANASRLRISANAHVVAPYHQVLDRVQERFLGKRAIGTTVFWGMSVGTFLGLVMIPIFFVIVRKLFPGKLGVHDKYARPEDQPY